MWARIDLINFDVQHRGMLARSAAGKLQLVSESLSNLESVDDLAHSEYGIAIEIHAGNRSIRFGRDYLGHYPLLYAISGSALLISDEIREIQAEIIRTGGRVSVSEEALALYFTMGYVPQGMTLYGQIIACRNACLYTWSSGSVYETSTFQAVETDQQVTSNELTQAIDDEFLQWHTRFSSIDIWSSGGLDSSLIAASAAMQASDKLSLLTMDYEPDIRAQYGTGEQPYAQMLADQVGIPLTRVTMTRAGFAAAYQSIAESYIGPVIDKAILPKYVLAGASRDCALTGEGGDPLFGGVKNTPFLFLRQNDGRRSLGHDYAIVHSRFFHQLRDIFVRGADLEQYVIEYFDRLFDRYPGDVLRKLFYLNTFEKQGGLIFSENYYAGKLANIHVRHPLTSRRVYEIAFSLPDHTKYRYPDGKLALIDAFRARLPDAIVNRAKSGTIFPLDCYLESVIDGNRMSLDAMQGMEGVREEAIDSFTRPNWQERPALEVHAWLMLDRWLSFNNGEKYEQHAALPGSSGYYQQQGSGYKL